MHTISKIGNALSLSPLLTSWRAVRSSGKLERPLALVLLFNLFGSPQGVSTLRFALCNLLLGRRFLLGISQPQSPFRRNVVPLYFLLSPSTTLLVMVHARCVFSSPSQECRRGEIVAESAQNIHGLMTILMPDDNLSKTVGQSGVCPMWGLLRQGDAVCGVSRADND